MKQTSNTRKWSDAFLQFDWCLIVPFILGIVAMELSTVPEWHKYRPLFLDDIDTALPKVKGEWVPSTGVSIIVAAAVFIASLLVFELAIERRRGVAGWTDAVAAVMRFTFSILTCWAVVNGTTEMVKIMMGRIRPDFATRCKPVPTGGLSMEEFTTKGTIGGAGLMYGVDFLCSNNPDLVMRVRLEGFNSFPSGHGSYTTAWSFYTALYIVWSLSCRPGWRAAAYGGSLQRLRSARGMLTRLGYECALVIWLLVALFLVAWPWGVGVTRVRGNFHNVDDVLAGLLLGLFFTPVFFARAVWQHEMWGQLLAEATAADEKLKDDQPPADAEVQLPTYHSQA